MQHIKNSLMLGGPIHIFLDADNTLFEGCVWSGAKYLGYTWQSYKRHPDSVFSRLNNEAVLGSRERQKRIQSWLYRLTRYNPRVRVYILTSNILRAVDPFIRAMKVDSYITDKFGRASVAYYGNGDTVLGKTRVMQLVTEAYGGSAIFLDDSIDNIDATHDTPIYSIWIKDRTGISRTHQNRVDELVQWLS